MQIPNKKWIALVESNQYYIGEDGHVFSGFWLLGSNNKQKLHKHVESVTWGKFHRGYMWKHDDYENGLPEYVFCSKVDEKHNRISPKLERVIYDELYNYEGHAPKDVLKFQEEAEEAYEKDELVISNHPEDWVE